MAYFSAAGYQAIRLGVVLGQTAALKDRILDRHLQPLGITSAQLKVLRIICSGDNTAVALCRQLSIHSAAMTRMLDRLERKGLLVRTPDERDQRQTRLLLTEAGRAVTAQLPALAGAAMNEFTLGLSAEELSRLEALLEKIVDSPLV